MDEQSIFLQSLEKETPEERAAWLDEVCGSETPLRQRIEALLRKHDQANSFLEQPAPEFEATLVKGDPSNGRPGE